MLARWAPVVVLLLMLPIWRIGLVEGTALDLWRRRNEIDPISAEEYLRSYEAYKRGGSWA